MTSDIIISLLLQHPLLAQATRWVASDGKHLQLSGLHGSAKYLMPGVVQHLSRTNIIYILPDAETAAYAYNDLNTTFSTLQSSSSPLTSRIALLTSSYRKFSNIGSTDLASEISRTDALSAISSEQPFIIVSSPEGVIQRVAPQPIFDKNRISLYPGLIIDRNTLTDRLEHLNFIETDFVYEPGQYSCRGSIIDIFSFSNERPYRLDFFDNEIESIRTFDIQRQLSIDECSEMEIIPEKIGTDTPLVSILDFIPSNTIIATTDPHFIASRIDEIYDNALISANKKSKTPHLLDIFINGNLFTQQLSSFRTIEVSSKSVYPDATNIGFDQRSQTLYHKNFDLLSDALHHYLSDGFKLYICSDSKKQTDRIASIFEERADNIIFTPILGTIHEGFIDNTISVCILTDHQIFDRYHKFSLRSDIAKQGKAALTLKEINQLQVGDYVVHIDHGIGRFGGLAVTENNGRRQEVIKLIYQNDDVIFVSIHGLHRISKYKGRDGEPPRISKLGTGAWERLKERTKSKVKDIARDLIQLYAARRAEKGFRFSDDSYLQHELEASFIYEDTPDQAKATADIKHDMETERPMDRLVCGDVGFGKTELAIRAAFKAITDNKQVAILVPTTVLAMQHYKTFSERLKDFPCTIQYLSRAKKPSEVKEIKQQLIDGKIDILIGTHKIVGSDIKFHDLGLLIIDEEQKFGVSVKEKLKALKVNVDTLTLTATPIPRTLQFSLMGARDLSILTTPPPNRYPITTELCTYDDEIIRQAIATEMDRNGQVFLINNRVQNIYLIEQKVKALIPGVRVAVAHGQMPTAQLEQTIIDFIDYEYDVLIATSVVESGIDIPNVNTIIVNNAHMFGLSDLHQLRGRVGRSNKKAYCYLIAPPLDTLPSDARRRLQAIETFADLGSGFAIAMQDLDIRGAGNILGAEQSGFITDLGYETYQKILSEALAELRDQEFADLFTDNNSNADLVNDCTIETDLSLMIPAWYVESQSERISLYRTLDNIQNEKALDEFKAQITDRFGTIPPEAESLFTAVRLRWIAKQYGIERLTLKQNRLNAYLISNTKSPFYKSAKFDQIISYCTTHYRQYSLSEKDGHRLFSITGITSVDQALDTLNEISNC